MLSHFPTKRCVAVLLATYNGEKYLDDQMRSLESQQNVCVHLFLWDDGSTDDTLSVFNRYEKINVAYRGSGKRLFASRAFLELLTNKLLDDFTYFAFCDQDDIWKPTKLQEAIEFLEKNSETVLYCTKREILIGDQILVEKYPKQSKELSSTSLTFENKCYGNTMVFNSILRKKFLEIDSSDLNMPHDWLIGRLALAVAKVHLDIRSQILYRIHSNNDTGRRSIERFRRLRLSRASKLTAFFLDEYLILLKRIQGKNLNGQMTLRYLSDLQSNSRYSLSLNSAQLRSNPYENLIFNITLKISLILFFVPADRTQI